MVIHGDADRRADVDHADRLLLLLKLYGKPHEEWILKDAKHSPTREQWISLLTRVESFLFEHNGPLDVGNAP